MNKLTFVVGTLISALSLFLYNGIFYGDCYSWAFRYTGPICVMSHPFWPLAILPFGLFRVVSGCFWLFLVGYSLRRGMRRRNDAIALVVFMVALFAFFIPVVYVPSTTGGCSAGLKTLCALTFPAHYNSLTLQFLGRGAGMISGTYLLILS